MEDTSLLAVSPIDGRYKKNTSELSNFFSEYALMKYRIMIEIRYFIALCEIPLPQLKTFSSKHFPKLKKIYANFSINDAIRIKEIEKTTNHDVKAIEYFIKEQFDKLNLQTYKEFIHFGLTSQDATNTALPCLLKDATKTIYIPLLNKVQQKLFSLAEEWKKIPMLAFTHGQPASPTRMGKEIMVFVERIDAQLKQLQNLPYSAKFGGATGNFNAHYVAYPQINWKKFADTFINKTLGLERLQYTTQIEHYDNFAAYCDAMKRINTILIDLTRDIWLYIAKNYFKQKVNPNETGSSTMPHKVNPIDFENSEGNLGIANAIFEHLAAKLPISRLQRDLTDSTVIRNIGVPVAHSIIAIKSLLKGLDKLLINKEAIEADLNDNWAVVAEAIQTILRREGYPNPYETLKALTRSNKKVTQQTIINFIDSLNMNNKIKTELKKITPHNYTGI